MKKCKKMKHRIAKLLALMMIIGIVGNGTIAQAEETAAETVAEMAEEFGDAVESVNEKGQDGEDTTEWTLTFKRKLFLDNDWKGGEPAQDKRLASGTEVSFDDQLIMEYFFAVPGGTQEELSGTAHILELPAGLRWATEVKDYPLYLNGTTTQYATLHCVKNSETESGKIEASLVFMENLNEIAPGGIDKAYVYLGCQLDGDELGEPDRPEKHEIVLDEETLTVLIKENQPAASSLSEKKGEYANGAVTWTMTYHPGFREAGLPLTFVDEFDPEYHDYAEGSLKFVKADNTELVPDAVSVEGVEKEDGKQFRRITCQVPETIAKESDPVTLTYKTVLTDKGLASTTDRTVDNMAWLLDTNDKQVGDAVTGQATLEKVDWLVKESAGGLQEDKRGNYLEWNVTINTNSKNLSKLILHDQMTNGQEHTDFVESDVGITAYRDEADTDESGSAAGHKIALHENGDGFDIIFNTKNLADRYVVNYRTYISEEYFHGGYNIDFTNNASLEYAWLSGDGNGTVEPENPPAVSKPIGVDGRMVTKAGAGYNARTHEITWEVKVNPHKLDLRNMILTDNLADKGLTYVEGSLKCPSSVQPEIQLDEQNKNLTLTFVNTGTESFTYTFRTTVDNPEDYAYNKDYAIYYNTVDATAVLKDGSPEGKELVASATGSQAIWSDVFQKGEDGYDYSDNTIGWRLSVNTNRMPMQSRDGILVEDLLAEGLSYVDGSLHVTRMHDNEYTGDTSDDNFGITVETNTVNVDGEDRQKLVFRYPSDQILNEHLMIRFRTKVDRNQIEAFKNSTTVTISNEATLKRADYGDVIWGTEQQIDNHILAKEGNYNKEQGTIEYRVNLNPHQMELKDAAVRDELEAGLQIDRDTIRLYETTVGADGTLTPSETAVDLTGLLKVNALEGWFEIKLPEPDKAYVLIYTADVVDFSKPSFSNKISLKGHEYGDAGSAETVAGPGAGGGGGGGTSSPKVHLTLNKVDAQRQGVKLAGAEFQISEKDGDNLYPVNKGVTDDNGTVVFRYLKRGKAYVIEETKAPEGYYLDEEQNSFEITISEDEEEMPREYTYPEAVKNEPVTGNISFVKKNDMGRVLEGVEFTLTDTTAGSEWTQTAVSDAEGNVAFAEIPHGIYTLTETKTPEYHSSDAAYKVVVDKEGKTTLTKEDEPDIPLTEIINTVKKADIRIEKIDRDLKTPLKDVEFSLYNAGEEDEPIRTGKTNEDGVVVFDNLEVGQTYVIRETVPKGYSAVREAEEITLTEEGMALTWENYRVGNATITVEDGEDQTPLPDVQWGLWPKDPQNPDETWEDVKDREPDKTVKSDKDGKISFEDLPEGDYWISMLDIPEGYEKDHHWLEVNVTFDEEGNPVITIKNPETGEELKDGIVGVTPLPEPEPEPEGKPDPEPEEKPNPEPEGKPDPEPEEKPNPEPEQKPQADKDGESSSEEASRFPITGDDAQWIWALAAVLLSGGIVAGTAGYRMYKKKRKEK